MHRAALGNHSWPGHAAASNTSYINAHWLVSTPAAPRAAPSLDPACLPQLPLQCSPAHTSACALTGPAPNPSARGASGSVTSGCAAPHHSFPPVSLLSRFIATCIAISADAQHTLCAAIAMDCSRESDPSSANVFRWWQAFPAFASVYCRSILHFLQNSSKHLTGLVQGPLHCQEISCPQLCWHDVRGSDQRREVCSREPCVGFMGQMAGMYQHSGMSSPHLGPVLSCNTEVTLASTVGTASSFSYIQCRLIVQSVRDMSTHTKVGQWPKAI